MRAALQRYPGRRRVSTRHGDDGCTPADCYPPSCNREGGHVGKLTDMNFRREARWMMLTLPVMVLLAAVLTITVLPVLRWFYSK